MHHNYHEVAASLKTSGRILIICSCFLQGNSFLSGETLRFEAALPHVIERAQIADLKEASTQASSSRLQAAEAFPNPSGIAEHEYLDGSPGDTDESLLGLSSSLDFIWKRGARIEAARQFGAIAPHRIAEMERQIAYRLAAVYLETAAGDERLNALSDVKTRLDEAYRISGSLVENGEIPPAHRRRIALSLEQLAMERVSLEADKIASAAEFQALTGIESAQPAELSIGDPAFPSVAAAVAAAHSHRPDLKALEAIKHWRESEVSRAKVESLPEASLDLAYKQDNEDRAGGFIGVSVEIPIFGENRASKMKAQAESFHATIEREQLRRKVASEVSAAYQRYESLKQQTGIDAHAGDDDYLRSELSAFQNGEASVVEYLDAIQVYRETLFTRIEHRQLQQQARLKLLFLTATEYPFSNSLSTHSK